MPRVSVRTLQPQASDCVTVRFDCTLAYKPGQAVALLLPGDAKKRYFSVSSSPTESSYVEITAKCEPGHPVTAALEKLKRGDQVELEGPFGGGLSLPEPLAHPLCMIAAGTGVTPFRSMVKYLVDQHSPVEVWLLHSVKRRDDLLFRQEFHEWAGANPWLHYVPTITQDFDDDWTNETGRINETLLKKHIPQKDATFLLCGPPAFITDMETLLTKTLAVPPGRIRREQW